MCVCRKAPSSAISSEIAFTLRWFHTAYREIIGLKQSAHSSATRLRIRIFSSVCRILSTYIIKPLSLHAIIYTFADLTACLTYRILRGDKCATLNCSHTCILVGVGIHVCIKIIISHKIYINGLSCNRFAVKHMFPFLDRSHACLCRDLSF